MKVFDLHKGTVHTEDDFSFCANTAELTKLSPSSVTEAAAIDNNKITQVIHSYKTCHHLAIKSNAFCENSRGYVIRMMHVSCQANLTIPELQRHAQ